ncbi:MAG: 50S ribosomal protein L4 [Chitinophagaceae bacterium]|nr:MAG: 50S ribosomal protein L4 [Chitinophagaceae bacterium]
MELEVLNIEGKTTGRKINLSDDVFKTVPNDHIIYLDVKRYMAAQRQGTHKTKERGEIRGSTRKIKKQKGTGSARFGDIKNPIFRGGGRIFGPRPRNYKINLNKKEVAIARRSALTYKLQDNQIKVIEDLSMEQPRTKEFISFLQNLNVEGTKVVYVSTELDKNVLLSARNIQRVQFSKPQQLNTYSILNANNLILTEKSVEVINEIFKK